MRHGDVKIYYGVHKNDDHPHHSWYKRVKFPHA